MPRRAWWHWTQTGKVTHQAWSWWHSSLPAIYSKPNTISSSECKISVKMCEDLFCQRMLRQAANRFLLCNYRMFYDTAVWNHVTWTFTTFHLYLPSYDMSRCVNSLLSDRTCPASLCSDEEIDFEQYSSGYSSAEVSSSCCTYLNIPVSTQCDLQGNSAYVWKKITGLWPLMCNERGILWLSSQALLWPFPHTKHSQWKYLF